MTPALCSEMEQRTRSFSYNTISNLGMTAATANAPFGIIDQSGTVAAASGNFILLK